MLKTRVSVVRTCEHPGDKEIDATVRRAVGLIGGLGDVVRSGATVVIKPNLVVARSPGSGATTDPRVCKTIADMVRERGARPIIAESSFVGLDTEDAIEVAGYAKLRKDGYDVIDLKQKGIEQVMIPVPQGRAMKEVLLPKVIVDADAVITVPKMKTHDQAGATLAIKNMKGVLPDVWKRKFHRLYGVFQSTADLLTVVKPSLAVVDGIVAMQGLGPAFGEPLEMDLIIAGRDVVAVDAVTGAVMGLQLHEIGCVREAAQLDVGTGDLSEIEVVGEPIATVRCRFKRAEEAIGEVLPLPQGFQLIVDPKACTGCRNQILSSLFDMKEANLLDKAVGWMVVCGGVERLPDVPPEKLLLVGACQTKSKCGAGHVAGCPPNSRDVIRGFGVPEAVGMVDIDAIESEAE
ncbi:DUF362 domain-containing protein [Chloroflexota bacterium]